MVHMFEGNSSFLFPCLVTFFADDKALYFTVSVKTQCVQSVYIIRAAAAGLLYSVDPAWCICRG